MILGGVKGLVLDLDGCVYVGDTPVDGAPEAIETLQRHFKLLYLTNNSTLTRKQYAEKLRRMDINAEPNQILTSGYVAVNYILSINPRARILVVGEDGVTVEALEAGLEVVDHNEWRRADFVVVGLDRKLTYEKLANAALAISAGAKFIATNLDHVYPSERGFLPGAGSIAALLATTTKVTPYAVGKPEKQSSEIALKMLGLSKEGVVFVGDRVDTDVKAGKIVGCRAVLVKTGAFKLLGGLTGEADAVIESVADLPQLLGI
ncbi:MAG: HAD-IIA family hydrolase [Candidatus Caldarchaeum sp.]